MSTNRQYTYSVYPSKQTGWNWTACLNGRVFHGKVNRPTQEQAENEALQAIDERETMLAVVDSYNEHIRSGMARMQTIKYGRIQ
jgi:hypothetical protein